MSSTIYFPPSSEGSTQLDVPYKRIMVIITNPLHRDILETIDSYTEHQKEIDIRYVEFNNLLNVLDVFVNAANVNKLFIITDAKNNYGVIHRQISLLSHKERFMGVWAFPNNQNQGDVNEFMDKITLCTNDVVKRVDDLIKTNERESNIVIPNNKKGIAKYYALMALQQDPTHTMKDAIDKGYFSKTDLLYQEFEKWINNILRND